MSLLNLLLGGVCIAVMFFILGLKCADFYWTLAAEEKIPMKVKNRSYHVLSQRRMMQLESTERAFYHRYNQTLKE